MENLKKALKLFLIFFKIGLTTFGGGYAMISIFEEEFVSKRSYITQAEMLEMVAIAESTPGPIAINSATYIGYKTAGVLGSILATVGVVLPAFIIMSIIAALLKNFSSNKWVKGFMEGVQPFVIGLIISTGLLIIVEAIYVNFGVFTEAPKFDFISLIVIAIVFIANTVFKLIKKKNLPAIPLILLSAVLGLIFF